MYTELMNEEDIVTYSFAVQIFKNEEGRFHYAVVQEIESDTEDELQLLETGGADTLFEAAEMVGNSLKTLFSV